MTPWIFPAALAAFIPIAAASSPAEARPPTREPRWRTIDSLNHRDKDLARAAASGLCPGPQCPGEAEFEAALVPVASGRDLLVIRFPSGGTCGGFEFAVYGPAGRGRRRLASRKGEPLIAECAERLLTTRRGSRMPDIRTISFQDRNAARPPALQTTIWRWTGWSYLAIARSRSRATITP